MSQLMKFLKKSSIYETISISKFDIRRGMSFNRHAEGSYVCGLNAMRIVLTILNRDNCWLPKKSDYDPYCFIENKVGPRNKKYQEFAEWCVSGTKYKAYFSNTRTPKCFIESSINRGWPVIVLVSDGFSAHYFVICAIKYKKVGDEKKWDTIYCFSNRGNLLKLENMDWFWKAFDVDLGWNWCYYACSLEE